MRNENTCGVGVFMQKTKKKTIVLIIKTAKSLEQEYILYSHMDL